MSILIIAAIIKPNIATILRLLQNMREPAVLLVSLVLSFHISFEVVLHALLLAWGESGHRGKERGFVLIVWPYPLTDTCPHAALWESAPTFRGGKNRWNSRRVVRGNARGKKWMPARHPALGRLLCFTQRFNCAKHCFISPVLCCVYIYMRLVFEQ